MNLYSIEEILVQQNLHWQPSVTKSTSLKRDYFPHFTKQLLQKKLILTLSGPRRVGKTFLLRQSIDWLIDTHHVNPKNICYFQFSGSHNESNVIQSLVNLYQQKYAGSGQTYIFLDEIQYIDYWQDQIKTLYDLPLNTKFIVSGSTSLFYHQKSKESLAGRINKLHLGALNFREYCRLKGIPEPSGDRAHFISKLSLYHGEFKQYLSTGQYPELVVNKELDAHQYILDLAEQVINFDIPYIHPKINRSTFSNIIKILSFNLADEFSLNNIAKIEGVDRREVTTYVKILEENNFFRTCYNAGLGSLRKRLAGSKKIYSLNLNLSLHINGFDSSYLGDTRVFGKYLENYIYMRLIEQEGNVDYYRLKSKELDFIALDQSYEVKLDANFKASKYEALSAHLKKQFHLISLEDAYLM